MGSRLRGNDGVGCGNDGGWVQERRGRPIAEGWWVIFVATTMWLLVESALVQGVADVFKGLRPAG